MDAWIVASGWVWGLVGWTALIVYAWKYDHREDR